MGLTASGVRKRITRGRMHRVHRGVYAVGHPILSVKGRWLAAVLACGPEAALSHRDAAAHRGLLHVGARVRIDVLSPSGAGRGRPGVEVHRGPLPEQDRTVLDGIPVTSLARTLLDLAEVIDRRGLERALDRAEQLRLVDMNAIDDVLQGAHGRHGATRLEAVLATPQAPRSPAASSRNGCWLSSTTTTSRDRRSTNGSPSTTTPATKPTCSGPTNASSSKPTGWRHTAPAEPPSTTVAAICVCSMPATGRFA